MHVNDRDMDISNNAFSLYMTNGKQNLTAEYEGIRNELFLDIRLLKTMVVK